MHLKRWYEHMSSLPELQALADEYYPKRNNAAKKKVAEAIKEAKSNKETANTRHTGKFVTSTYLPKQALDAKASRLHSEIMNNTVRT